MEKWRGLIEHAWMGLDEHEVLEYANPFNFMTDYDRENPDVYLLNIMRKPENFYFTCKFLFNVKLMPFQSVIIQNLWNSSFPILLASRGSGKSFASAIYLLLRAVFLQGRKIVIIAPGFRQAKNVMNYIENVWNNSPILQDLFAGSPQQSGPRHDSDRWTLRVGYSTITALPLGIDGDRIRGERSNDTFIEEIQSFPGTEVLERVVGGFSVVSSSPVEKVQQASRMKVMKDLGLIDDKQIEDIKMSMVKNQQIMCGTAYYEWNHFAQYHAKWKKIIQSKGEYEKVKEVFTTPEGVVDIPDGFDWRDYSIIRIPVDVLPDGYMDSSQVARARATMHVGLYEMEYKTMFVRDSNGFYRATLIDSATANEKNIIQWGKFFGENMEFSATLQGKDDKRYVFGLDPASERDNFAVVVLELHKTHRRVVYCWTFDKKKHRNLLNSGLIQETDYYGYIARKVRELLKVFPSDYIGIDAQGGGIGAMEAFHSKANLLEGEDPIWPAIIEDEEQDTDNYPGLHIMYPVQFANAKWTMEANHGMRKDLEDKRLIFPMFDSVSLMQSYGYLKDKNTESLYTSLEDVMLEIEEMKRELISIVHTTTKNGTERWDTPEVKISGQKKENQKKDRYSALLIANAIARSIDKLKAKPMIIGAEGGFVGGRTYGTSKSMYNAPDWFTQNIGDAYGFV